MKKTGIFKTMLALAFIALTLIVGFASAKYVQSSNVGSFNLTVEKRAYTYNLIDGPSFNSTLKNKASAVENVTFCSKANLNESTISNLTLTHIGATENDAVYLGVSSDGKTAYVFADSADPNQKVIAGEDCSSMFYYCDTLITLDFSGLDTANATDMNSMFYRCYGLTALDLSGFDTANATDMNSMFLSCYRLTDLDVTGFDTANVTNMSSMFDFCDSLTTLDLSGFDTANVTNMSRMFNSCNRLTTIYASENFVTDQVTNSDSMFNACVNLVGGKGTVYDNSNIDKSYAHIDGGTSNPGYFTDKNAKANLNESVINDTPVLLTWMNTLMTWGEKIELKIVINDIDNTDGLQTNLTIENEAGDQVQEPVTLTAKNNEWTVLIDTFAFTEGVYKVTVSEITDPTGEREFTGGFVSSSCVIRISPCQISFSDTSTTIGYGTDKTITGSINGLPDGNLPDCFNSINVNLVSSCGEIVQVPIQIIREASQTVYQFDIPNDLKASTYNVYVNLKEVSGYVIGPNNSLEPKIGTVIVSFNANSLASAPTENNEMENAQDSELEPAA